MSTAALTLDGKDKNDNNNNNEKPVNVQLENILLWLTGKLFKYGNFILFIFILLFISNHILTYYH